MEQQQFIITKYFDLTDFPFKDIFEGIIYPWEALTKIEDYIRSFIEKNGPLKEMEGKTGVFIGDGTEIHPSVEIEGPALIGKNCTIGHASLLRGGVIFGDDVHIGHAVEIKHSILLNNAIAAHLNYLGDSIIGHNANIAGGAILANYRLDKKPVSMRTADGKFDTGLEKFGALIGDGSSIGVNAVLNPGTALGKDCRVYPLVSVRGAYEEGSIIKQTS
jgi:UDP-N-acetylglucosamine diphosphorylase / glucose-1-phosphate thymidylyltransferase / UDP-N-acetylgalactosamine diphosphorylase / glucosamine-1-phosphate N-acetyltransferase / galactosamine-1-phosphate N-acetyltransferase